MNHPIFAANWKMNHGPSAARAFMRTFLSQYQRQYDRTIIFFPPALSLGVVAEAAEGRSDILVGVQNIYWKDKGAFTGEISPSIARDAGAQVVLVGHSERRHVFGETEDDTAEKCAAAERAGLTPMLCVGETLKEREKGDTARVVLRQLRAGLSKLQNLEASHPMIAYEPVWAIGTGKNATPEDAAEIHGVIRYELRSLVGDRAKATAILYGGSVNPGNVSDLLAASDVDGVLVGGASLDTGSWSAIAHSRAKVPTAATGELPPEK